MEQAYHALPSHPLPPDTTFQQPVLAKQRNVTLKDFAVDVMTDFQSVRAITVPASVSMDYALERMRANHVHLLLVTDERNTILGLITSTDIESEKPLIAMRRLGVRREALNVADVMTVRERIEVVNMEDVARASVGDVVATLKAVGRQHAMVIDSNDSGRRVVRGLFAVSQLNRQLGTLFHPIEIARTFCEVETALAHI
jgi:CBS domain containing-hemolysin-like protein